MGKKSKHLLIIAPALLLIALYFQNCGELGMTKKKLKSGLEGPGWIEASGSPIPLAPGDLQKIAFHEVNQVYLSVTGNPTRGQFLSQNGNPIGNVFNIATEGASFDGWANVTAGGSASDPVFLFTYVAVEGASHVKYGRIIRYNGGSPSVGARFLITDVTGEWYAAERAQTIWHGNRFIVGTRKNFGGAYPGPILHHVDSNGNVTGSQLLATGADHQGGPSLACSESGVCLAVGFTSGTPLGVPGGTWGRMFDGNTLAPTSDLFYLDDHIARLDEQQVVYNPQSQKFLVVWARQADGGWVDFRQVSLSGTLSPMDYSRSFGPGAGDIGLSFNAATGTALLTTKYLYHSDLYALQLGSDGYPSDIDNLVLITQWDERVLAYYNVSAPNRVNRQWLVAYGLADGWKVQTVLWSP